MKTNISLRNQAELYASSKQWSKAIECFESLLAQRPSDADVLLQLSYVSSLAGMYRQAHKYTLAAASAAPRDPEQLRELLARLRTFNEIPALYACLARLGPARKLPTTLLLSCADHLINLNDEGGALAMLDEVQRRDPGLPPVMLLRGQALLQLGRFAEAEAELLTCVRRAPNLPRAWGLLVSLGRQEATANYVSAIRVQLARPNCNPRNVAELGFALHRALDDCGDHAGAWQALALACKAKRGSLHYQTQDSVDLINALIAMPTPVAIAAPSSSDIGPSQLPIFVVGMHRSGTTLLEQLLHGHPEVRGLGELYDFTSRMREATDHHCRGVVDQVVVQRAAKADYREIGRGYLNGLTWRIGAERAFVDKLPSNFFNVGFICRALPQARILHMRRDPMDTCFSNLRELFAEASPYSYDQRELGTFYRHYERLMQHWHAQFPDRILDVEYASLVSDTEATLRKVTQFCGLPFDMAMLATDRQTRSVSTASAVAVRQQIASRNAPRWAAYARHLQPLMDALKNDCEHSSAM